MQGKNLSKFLQGSTAKGDYFYLKKYDILILRIGDIMDKNNILKVIVGVLAFILIGVVGYTVGNIVEGLPKKEYIEKDITFIGIITEIKNESVIYVKGTNDNSKDFRKTYELNLNNNSKIIYNYEEVDFDLLKIGNQVEVTFKGEYADIYPALLDRVSKIEVVKNEQ